MNKLDLIDSLQKSEVEKLQFTLENKEITNRFDEYKKTQYKKGDLLNEITDTLYSFIANAIILKAQSNSKKDETFKVYNEYLENILKNLKIKTKENTSFIKDNAVYLLQSFIYSKESTSLEDLINKLLPLCVYKVIEDNPCCKARKIKRISKWKYKVIQNVVILYLRSLNHSFFIDSEIDAEKISIYTADFSLPVFKYDKTLFISTWQNAYNLTDYKKVCINSISNLDEKYVSDVDSISLLYFTKNIIVKNNL